MAALDLNAIKLGSHGGRSYDYQLRSTFVQC